MRTLTRRAGIVAAGLILALFGSAGAAFAGDYYCPPPEPTKKCNAGNGNGSEGCDPGNSGAHNRGGDEVPPGIPNPGGNNVP